MKRIAMALVTLMPMISACAELEGKFSETVEIPLYGDLSDETLKKFLALLESGSPHSSSDISDLVAASETFSSKSEEKDEEEIASEFSSAQEESEEGISFLSEKSSYESPPNEAYEHRCDYCTTFKSTILAALRSHVSTEHPEEFKTWLLCKVCNQQYTRPRCYDNHLRDRHHLPLDLPRKTQKSILTRRKSKRRKFTRQ